MTWQRGAAGKDRMREHYRANRDILKRRSKLYYDAHRELVKKKRSQHYRANRKLKLEYSMRYYRDNMDVVKKKRSLHYKANRDSRRRYGQEYYAANKERKAEYYRDNRERRLLYARNYSLRKGKGGGGAECGEKDRRAVAPGAGKGRRRTTVIERELQKGHGEQS